MSHVLAVLVRSINSVVEEHNKVRKAKALHPLM